MGIRPIWGINSLTPLSPLAATEINRIFITLLCFPFFTFQRPVTARESLRPRGTHSRHTSSSKTKRWGVSLHKSWNTQCSPAAVTANRLMENPRPLLTLSLMEKAIPRKKPVLRSLLVASIRTQISAFP